VTEISKLAQTRVVTNERPDGHATYMMLPDYKLKVNVRAGTAGRPHAAPRGR